MGQSIFTAKQSHFLELAKKDSWLTKNFFLSGGTALSEFYLHHRLSKDLGFFSQKEMSHRSIRSFLRKVSPKLGIKSFKFREIFGIHTSILKFNKNQNLKVDFSYYPFPPIERWTFMEKLKVASIYDIAVDKLHSIFNRSQARDFIDFYFILKEKGYRLEKILKDIRVKFDVFLEPGSLSSQFLKN